MKTIQIAIAGLALAIGLQVCPVIGKVIYVDDDAKGSNDGSRWQNAYVFLQDALAMAKDGDEIRVGQGIYKPDQGGGKTPGDRGASFVLIDGVAIYGGFPNGGGEWKDRDPNNETVLSGDLNNDDKTYTNARDLVYDAPDRRDNSYHVVRASKCDIYTILDMVTIKGGHTTDEGGGIYISDGGKPTINKCLFFNNYAYLGGGGLCCKDPLSKPDLKDCIFERNRASGGGGGAIKNYNSTSPQIIVCLFIENYSGEDWGYSRANGGAISNKSLSRSLVQGCTFKSNKADANGGAIANDSSQPEITECNFDLNVAGEYGGAIGAYGGAIFNEASNPSLSKCTLYRNEAKNEGGAIYNSIGSSPRLVDCNFLGNVARSGGGAIKNDGKSNPNIINCLFNHNETFDQLVGDGGAMHNNNASSPRLVNCTFYDNCAGRHGGGIYNSKDSQPTLTNCILSYNSDQFCASMDELAQLWYSDPNDPARPIVNYCCIMGWTGKLDGEGNIDCIDPRFLDPDGLDNRSGSKDDDLRLDVDSPCIDAGDNTAIPLDIKVDLEGVNRFQQGLGIPTGKGTPPIVDIGAHELCSLRLLPVSSLIRQDWEKLGQPVCWCTPYQCDGDADAVTSGFPFDYRVFTGDLSLIVNNWKKKIDDPALNPCADIDHKDSGFPFEYRVFTGDLSRLVVNWKKKDAQLRGDCPRPEQTGSTQIDTD